MLERTGQEILYGGFLSVSNPCYVAEDSRPQSRYNHTQYRQWVAGYKTRDGTCGIKSEWLGSVLGLVLVAYQAGHVKQSGNACAAGQNNAAIPKIAFHGLVRFIWLRTFMQRRRGNTKQLIQIDNLKKQNLKINLRKHGCVATCGTGHCEKHCFLQTVRIKPAKTVTLRDYYLKRTLPDKR